MIVVDVLLVCNLVLFAFFALRGPRPGRSRLDDVLFRAWQVDEPDDGRPMGKIVPFPSGDEMALRRARADHPAGRLPSPAAAHRSHLSPAPQLSARYRHPSGGLL